MMDQITHSPSHGKRPPALFAPTRRRFLQGLAAAGGVTAAGIPTWLAGAAGAATPIGATDGVLVVVNLLGGNDGLNTLVPRTGADRSPYEAHRQELALPAESLRSVGDGTYGLHPSLTGLADRFAEGKVAVVRGVGTNGDLSHFATQATMMAGTAGTSRTTGWLGRYTDGLTDWQSGFRGVAIGVAVPLHLVGTRAEVTALPAAGGLWGSNPTAAWDRSSFAAMRAMAASPTGLGPMADEVAGATVDALDRAAITDPIYAGAVAGTPLWTDLTMAARVINADLGTRCINVMRQGFDTHARQLDAHAALLTELDQAISGFFSTLAPAFRNRVTVLVLSEFGRRVARNASSGTDHGSAGVALLVGDNVKGGLYGANPSLTTLDASGSLVPTVDLRSVYASVLSPWLAGDGSAVLGKTYEDLQLFSAGPGTTPAA